MHLLPIHPQRRHKQSSKRAPIPKSTVRASANAARKERFIEGSRAAVTLMSIGDKADRLWRLGAEGERGTGLLLDPTVADLSGRGPRSMCLCSRGFASSTRFTATKDIRSRRAILAAGDGGNPRVTTCAEKQSPTGARNSSRARGMRNHCATLSSERLSIGKQTGCQKGQPAIRLNFFPGWPGTTSTP